MCRKCCATISGSLVARDGPIDDVMCCMLNERTALAKSLMDSFAERTGLIDGTQRRYLWTDAFAVCNFLGLRTTTGDPRYDELATRLVDAVHNVLGRHRADASRSGWLSGLSDDAGQSHPTLAGLRIGKPLTERASGQSFDPDLEWDRDGQYFHYLTKWMHALDQMARARNEPQLLMWASELADTAHRRFTYGAGAKKRMYWKMSIDLMRPLVASMGQHDPLDGLLTCLDLQATAATFGASARGPDLSDAITDFAVMIDPASLATSDPLGIGGLLVDSCRLALLIRENTRRADARLLESLLAAAFHGLRHFSEYTDLTAPANRRLAFRELGLTIGLSAIELIDRNALTPGANRYCSELDRFARVGRDIEAFWMYPDHRAVQSWVDHEDINDVMLATSLAPDGFLVRPSVIQSA